jgi:phage tail-like protein
MGRPEALVASGFVVAFDGAGPAYFSELSGISSEIEPVEYIASDAKTGGAILTKQFGKKKPPTVTLKRGVDGTAGIFAWHMLCSLAPGGAARMSGTLSLMSPPVDISGKQTVLSSFWLQGAWPSKVEMGNIKAGASEVVLETVTFTCESITPMGPDGNPMKPSLLS